MMRFEAPLDGALKATTALGGILIAGAAAVPAALAASDPGTGLALGSALGAAGAAAVLLAGWALSPAGYALAGGHLLVRRRLARPIEVPLSSVRGVALLPPEALRGAIRTFGSGGLFGHYGRFRSRALGAFRMYATRRRDLVAVRTADGLLVLSPEPARAFVDAVLARAPGARELGGEALDAGAPAPGWTRWLPAAVVAGALLAVAATLGVAWARAPRSIRVEGGEVVVERNRWSPARIPLAEVRAVEPVPAAALRGLRRVSGYAAGEVRYGTFSSPALGRFELQAPRRGPCVRLETADGAVLVVPDDPEAFLATARAGAAAGR
jgi:hypothetical protein